MKHMEDKNIDRAIEILTRLKIDLSQRLEPQTSLFDSLARIFVGPRAWALEVKQVEKILAKAKKDLEGLGLDPEALDQVRGPRNLEPLVERLSYLIYDLEEMKEEKGKDS